MEIKIGTDLYIVVKQTEYGDIWNSENVAIFTQYRNAVAYVNTLPTDHKMSYDIEELKYDDE